MKRLQVAKSILPLGEFKTHASRVLRELKESHSPIVITQNGRPAAVLVLPEEFDLLNEQNRFVNSIREGVADADAGRLSSDSELELKLNSEFGPLKKQKAK